MISMNFDQNEVISSALAGILGTLAFAGFFFGVGKTGTIKGAIPALYGLKPSLIAGMLIHLVHGAILGVLYTIMIKGVGYSEVLEDSVKSGLAGLGYGVLTTVLLAAVLMPVWLSTMGFPKAPTAPNFSPIGLVGHLIYGVILGATYPLIRKQFE